MIAKASLRHEQAYCLPEVMNVQVSSILGYLRIQDVIPGFGRSVTYPTSFSGTKERLSCGNPLISIADALLDTSNFGAICSTL